MPTPVIYTGTDDDDQTRSIDFVHIEPSIREGVHLVSSLYGRDASSPLFRFAPTNIFPPYITGPEQIPGRLICNSGQWTGSPSPIFAYQWMRDGVDIPGAIAYEYFTTEPDDNTVITCEVRGYNYMGEDYALTSNSIAVSLIEPIEIWEQENYVIQGLQAPKIQTLRDEREVIITGLGAANRLDMNRGVAYFLTGLSANNRSDINASEYFAITGLNQNDTLSILERDYGVAVISRTIGEPLIDGVPQALRLINPDAEMGTEGWDIFGTVSYESNYALDGDHSFWGGADADAAQFNTPYSYMWQDVPMYEPHYVDIDAAACFVNLLWFQRSDGSGDMANIKVEFYAANGTTLIGVNSGPGLWSAPSNSHFGRSANIPIPAATRFIRVMPEFNLISGTDINAYIDSINMTITKGSQPNSRAYGPSFEQWRLRFTQANTYSGGGLSELEFRSTPGALDLATGGVPVFGSAGQGVTNADLAFDDLKNTGYWCGAELSISQGTSWIGYNMGTPVRPQEIAITARPGSDALQVPRQMVLEGSNDGLQWIPVQEIDEYLHTGTPGVNYNSGETRTIALPIQGAFPYFKDHPAIGTPVYLRNASGVDDFLGKGMIMQAVARFNITQLCVYLDDNSNDPFPYRLQLYRLGGPNDFANSSFNFVTEVLQDIELTAPGTTSGLQWVDTPVFAAQTFEPGDHFMIRIYDPTAASNPVDANEARTRYVSDWGGTDPYLFRRLAKYVWQWNGDSEVLTEGDYNPDATNTSSGKFYWTLDYRGNVF